MLWTSRPKVSQALSLFNLSSWVFTCINTLNMWQDAMKRRRPRWCSDRVAEQSQKAKKATGHIYFVAEPRVCVN
jgi:hypothetical protein